jgi:uncharacterized surface protein with fasciclin (FAS1) repeats
MKNKLLGLLLIGFIISAFPSCNSSNVSEDSPTQSEATSVSEDGQSTVEDDVSEKNVVRIAVGSPDHSTLVAAVKAAKLVDALSNAGPFTVFAPTNAAFDALPAGTVDGLLKPEKIGDLQNILQYHVSVGVFKTENFSDGQVIGQANDGKVTIGVKDGKYTVNGATIIASIPASNGLVHVIDGVLLPPAAK